MMLKPFRSFIFLALGGFVVGTLCGWFVLGWGLAPVKWTDAAPVDLQQSYRAFYLRTLANAQSTGAINADELAKLGIGERWKLDDVVAELTALERQSGNTGRYQPLINAVVGLGGKAGAQPAPAAAPVSPLVWLLVAAVVIVVAFLSLQLVRRSGQPAAQVSGGAKAALSRSQASTQAVLISEWEDESAPPLRQFEMNYVLGDDRFDMSNAIETTDGMFLGECGVGISETIGVGDPDKVTAFEVWLFDKNDIRTVTAVLMSQHAFNDAALRAKLAPKGEAVLADPVALIKLETATLRVRARVAEMEYGSGPLPDKSFFQKLHVSMAAWQIGDGGVTQPAPAVV
jgi:hypothetical protein